MSPLVKRTNASPAPLVVKIGGGLLSDPAWLPAFAAKVAHSTSPVVVVHGGGPEIDALSARLGIAVERQAGLRLTSHAALEVSAMVLTGLLNKRLVAALLGAGVDALGLSGEDGALVVAGLAEGGSLGRVGEVAQVRAELVSGLLSLGLTPVVSPISRGTDGGALNVNADDVAVALASALCAPELLFLTDVPAVRDNAGDLALLDQEQAVALLGSGVVRDGMAVKVRAGLRAVEAGVASVRIGGMAMLIDPTAGTRLGRFQPAGRQARVAAL